MKTFLSVLLMAGVVAGAMARGETQWQPGRTYVMVASITAWPASAGLASFTGTRRDADLVEQFKAAGIPSGNIVLSQGQRGHASRHAKDPASSRREIGS